MAQKQDLPGAIPRLRRKRAGCDESFQLNAIGIERCSELLEATLEAWDVERQNRIRIRFSFEESLLRFREHFGEEQSFSLRASDRFGGLICRSSWRGAYITP